MAFLEDRDLAVLFAVQAGLEGRALEAATDLDERGLDVCLQALVHAGLLERRGWLRSTHHLSATGTAALEGYAGGVMVGLAAEGLRRVDPALPFEPSTIWKEAICVNIAVAPEALRPLVPPIFELDLCNGWAWVSLTASRLEDFGVGRLPRPLRLNFYQATYRAHVRYRALDGSWRQGCYFVRSDTNSPLMSRTANLLPEFRAHRCGVAPMVMARDGGKLLLTVDTQDRGGKVVLVLDESADALPPDSRFGSLDNARRVIVDFVDAYAFEPRTEEVLILRIERGAWNFTVPAVVDAHLGYVAAGPFPEGSSHVDSVFAFREVPYRWLPLIKERHGR